MSDPDSINLTHLNWPRCEPTRRGELVPLERAIFWQHRRRKEPGGKTNAVLEELIAGMFWPDDNWSHVRSYTHPVAN